MNAEQCQVAANHCTNPDSLIYKATCMQLGNYIHYCHLLLLSPKADTHVTDTERIEGRVILGYTETM